MHSVKILSRDGKTELIVDGVPMQSGCTGFRLEQSGGDSAVLTLELLCHDLEIDGSDIVMAQGEQIAAPAATDAAMQSRDELGSKG